MRVAGRADDQQDIDFRVALAAAAQRTEPLGMTTTVPNHLKGELPSPESRLMYRVPLAPALDGNTVDSDLEQAAFAENNVRYQASLSFVSDEFRGLMTAIIGR